MYGHSHFSNTGLWALPLSLETLTATGEAFPSRKPASMPRLLGTERWCSSTALVAISGSLCVGTVGARYWKLWGNRPRAS